MIEDGDWEHDELPAAVTITDDVDDDGNALDQTPANIKKHDNRLRVTWSTSSTNHSRWKPIHPDRAYPEEGDVCARYLTKGQQYNPGPAVQHYHVGLPALSAAPHLVQIVDVSPRPLSTPPLTSLLQDAQARGREEGQSQQEGQEGQADTELSPNQSSLLAEFFPVSARKRTLNTATGQARRRRCGSGAGGEIQELMRKSAPNAKA